ncbi:MAG: hypothetical protein O7D91_15670 [Planctomycetota bacterium]|nr:hypothetical protein [Planctomycetota bacterium]
MIEYDTALLKNDQAKEAEPVLRECLSIREKVLKKDDWLIAEARGVLGECLTGQGADPSLALGVRIDESDRIGKLREAETILVELANAALEDDTVSKDDKTKAIQPVIDLYHAWHAAEPDQGYDAKADQWRAKLAPRASDSGGDD